jgi:hypothetical protein
MSLPVKTGRDMRQTWSPDTAGHAWPVLISWELTSYPSVPVPFATSHVLSRCRGRRRGQEHKRGLNFPIVIETWVPRRA